MATSPTPPDQPEPDQPDSTEPETAERARGAVPRRTRLLSTVLVAVLCAGLGMAIVTQVRGTASGDSLDTARPSDLVVLLDTLHQREATLRGEIAQLQDSITAQQGSGQGSAAALADAQARAQALAVLVGTAAAAGPGVVLTLRDPQARVGPEVLLDAVQELRAAGAEAIQVTGSGGGAVRVGMDTAVTGSAGALRVDGSTLSAPYRVVAIGDAPTLAAALNIPGGVIDTVARAGGGLAVEQLVQVRVDAVRTLPTPQHARPAGR